MVSRGEKLEREFQSNLILRLRELIEPYGYVMKLDTSYIQGIPDLLILYKKKWAVLECKRSSASEFQPNQEYYIQDLNGLSFAAVIYPANEDEVIHDLQQALGIRTRRSRIPKSK